MERTCPDRPILLLFTEGELDAGELERVAAHVRTCSVCGRVLEELREVSSALRDAAGARGSSGAASRDGTGSGQCPAAGVIAEYVDRSLCAEDSAAVERHLASCRLCLSEVADLWHMMGPHDHDAPDRAVEGAVAKLRSDARTAVLRWVGRSVELVRGFPSALGTAASGAGGVPVPAVAAARSEAAEARLLWSGEDDIELTGAVRAEGETVSLTGRVTVGGAPATATSAGLSSAGATEGPESVDADGRFGPWPLHPGRNLLRLTGLPGGSGRAELVVMVIGADEPEEPH